MNISTSKYKIPNTPPNVAPILRSAWLYMSPREWGISLGVSFSIALLLVHWYFDISLWIGLGVLLASLTLINMVLASRYMLPYPQLAILIACIQLILAPWGNHYYPLIHPLYDLRERLPGYLSYAVPACFLFACGLISGFIGLRVSAHNHKVPSEAPVVTRQVVRELNTVFGIGLAASFLHEIVPSSLGFLFVLLGNFAFVGAFGYVLLNIPGWKIRAGIVMLLLFIKSLQDAMFHDLVVWGASFVLVLAFSRGWSRRHIFSVIIGGWLAVMLIISVKDEYRDQFWFGRTYIADSRVMAFSALVLNTLSSPGTLFSSNRMAEIFQRLNQGWIVNRVMIWTPQMEPYARGKTLLDNVVGALVPRFLNPSKGEVGGREDYERYTGQFLVPGTSMALGFAGEMYVNFGARWGVLAVGLYGLIIGLGFAWLSSKALKHPLWWAWAAYFACIAIKAESSIGYMANWVLKAAVVMIGVVWLCPAMRQVLLKSARRTEPHHDFPALPQLNRTPKAFNRAGGGKHRVWSRRSGVPGSKLPTEISSPCGVAWRGFAKQNSAAQAFHPSTNSPTYRAGESNIAQSLPPIHARHLIRRGTGQIEGKADMAVPKLNSRTGEHPGGIPNETQSASSEKGRVQSPNKLPSVYHLTRR